MHELNSLHGDLTPTHIGGDIWPIALVMSEALVADIKKGYFDDDRRIILELWESKDFRKALKAVEKQVKNG